MSSESVGASGASVTRNSTAPARISQSVARFSALCSRQYERDEINDSGGERDRNRFDDVDFQIVQPVEQSETEFQRGNSAQRDQVWRAEKRSRAGQHAEAVIR